MHKGHAIVELGTARAAEAFAAPGKEEDDFWAFQAPREPFLGGSWKFAGLGSRV